MAWRKVKANAGELSGRPEGKIIYAKRWSLSRIWGGGDIFRSGGHGRPRGITRRAPFRKGERNIRGNRPKEVGKRRGEIVVASSPTFRRGLMAGNARRIRRSLNGGPSGRVRTFPERRKITNKRGEGNLRKKQRAALRKESRSFYWKELFIYYP